METKIYTEDELCREFEDFSLACDDLIEWQGQGKFYLVDPAFHGGGIRQQFRSLRVALRRQRAMRNSHTGDSVVFGNHYRGYGCRCGGPHLVTSAQYNRLSIASNARSAYDPAQGG